MYRILFVVIVLPFVIWLFIKLIRSPKYDKFCKDLFSGKLDTDITFQDNIKDISKAENDLGKQVEQNTKEAEKLKQDAKGIQEFLGDRGVSEAKKKKEGSE